MRKVPSGMKAEVIKMIALFKKYGIRYRHFTGGNYDEVEAWIKQHKPLYDEWTKKEFENVIRKEIKSWGRPF